MPVVPSAVGGGAAQGAATLDAVLPQLQAIVGQLQVLVSQMGGGVVGGGAPANQPGQAPTAPGGCGCGGSNSPVQAPKPPNDDKPKRAPNPPGPNTPEGRAHAARAQNAAAGADRGKWLSGDLDGLNPVLLDRLAKLGERLGQKIDIVSGHRSRAEQEVLYQKYLNGTGNLAAKPGTSNHESGNAADAKVGGVSLQKNGDAARIAAELGLHFPVQGEPWHVEIK